VFTLKKEQGTNTSGAAAPLPSGQFIFDAWTIASEKLKALNVRADLIRCDGPEFPDGLTNICAINPSVAADGSIPAELWTVISSISHVMLRLPSVNDSTLLQVSQHPGLIGLVISGDSDLTPNGITPLKNCINLRSLVFSGIPVTPELLNAVAQLSDLRFFAIADCSVSGEMVASIVRLSKLKILSLQNAGVTDTDMAVIANITTLERLLLDNAKLTDQGLDPLKKLSGLKILGVSGINITPQALADFEAAVPGCRILK